MNMNTECNCVISMRSQARQSPKRQKPVRQNLDGTKMVQFHLDEN